MLEKCLLWVGGGGGVLIKSRGLCWQRTGVLEVDDKFTGSVATYSCRSSVNALPLNAPLWHTVPVRDVNQVEKEAPHWPVVIVYGAPGGARRWKKQELKNTLLWWAGCSCGFVIASTIRGPDRLPENHGRGKKRYVIPHDEQREKKMWVLDSTSAFLPFFSHFVLPLPIHPSRPQLTQVRTAWDWSPSCCGWDNKADANLY